MMLRVARSTLSCTLHIHRHGSVPQQRAVAYMKPVDNSNMTTVHATSR